MLRFARNDLLIKLHQVIAVPLTRHCRMYLAESNLPRTVDTPHNRHSGMFLAGIQ